MNQDFLKALLKKIRQEEDAMSLLFGALAIGSLIYLAIAYSLPKMQKIGWNMDVQSWMSSIQEKFAQKSNVVGTPSVQPEENVRMHKTTKEDTLWKLGQQYYNDGHQWVKIYEANRSIIANPNILEKDLELVIPE